jgi:hypothetical protein
MHKPGFSLALTSCALAFAAARFAAIAAVLALFALACFPRPLRIFSLSAKIVEAAVSNP